MKPDLTEQEVLDWVIQTCLLLGAQRSTALRVAAEFAKAFERGLISVKPEPLSGSEWAKTVQEAAMRAYQTTHPEAES